MPDLKAAALGNVNLSDLESHNLLAFDGNGSSHAFFVSFLSLCKDNSDGMK
jgi:hypothetical protein